MLEFLLFLTVLCLPTLVARLAVTWLVQGARGSGAYSVPRHEVQEERAC